MQKQLQWVISKKNSYSIWKITIEPWKLLTAPPTQKQKKTSILPSRKLPFFGVGKFHPFTLHEPGPAFFSRWTNPNHVGNAWGLGPYNRGPTVDGWNPAPPRMMIIPLFIGFHTSQVVQDFSHQQYVQLSNCQTPSKYFTHPFRVQETCRPPDDSPAKIMDTFFGRKASHQNQFPFVSETLQWVKLGKLEKINCWVKSSEWISNGFCFKCFPVEISEGKTHHLHSFNLNQTWKSTIGDSLPPNKKLKLRSFHEELLQLTCKWRSSFSPQYEHSLAHSSAQS